MRYFHYKVIHKDTGHVMLNSEGIKKNDGFGHMRDWEGWKTEKLAEFWARDAMTLHSLDRDEYIIEITNNDIAPPAPKEIPPKEGRFRINVICPQCEKDKLFTLDNKEAWCVHCKTEFIIMSSSLVKHKKSTT
jgi:hypothetical protein